MTAAMRGGDFSSPTIFPAQNIGTDPSGAAILNGAIYDPATRTTLASGQVVTTVFPGNKIPVSRFDPVAGQYPEPDPQAYPGRQSHRQPPTGSSNALQSAVPPSRSRSAG